MRPAERKGYLWNFYGYTKLHLWGCYLTGTIFSFFGAALLVVPAILWTELSDRIFLRLILLSIACFAAATAVAAGSVFTLIYFRGCDINPSDSVSPSTQPPIPNGRNA